MTKEEMLQRTTGIILSLEDVLNGDRPEIAMAILDAARLGVVAAFVREREYEVIQRALNGQAGIV